MLGEHGGGPALNPEHYHVERVLGLGFVRVQAQI